MCLQSVQRLRWNISVVLYLRVCGWVILPAVAADLTVLLRSDHCWSNTTVSTVTLVCVCVCVSVCECAHISGHASTCPWLAGRVDVAGVKQFSKHSAQDLQVLLSSMCFSISPTEPGAASSVTISDHLLHSGQRFAQKVERRARHRIVFNDNNNFIYIEAVLLKKFIRQNKKNKPLKTFRSNRLKQAAIQYIREEQINKIII